MIEKKRILIMEDNPDLAQEWKEAFELNECEVVLSFSGAEAKKFLELEKFDLVVTDLFVKGKRGGLFVLTQLTIMGVDAPPCIAVTGAFAHSDSVPGENLFLAQANRMGAAFSISKPFQPVELVMLAFECWDGPSG